MVVGCSGERSEAPQKGEQGHTEATERDARSPEATTEEARCEGTRTIEHQGSPDDVTNDVPGCPNGGLLSGTDKGEFLLGKKGEDEIHGLGGEDYIDGGLGSDIIYGGAEGDFLVGDRPGVPDRSKDVLYGGDGDEQLIAGGKGEDVLYGGKGDDSLDGDERSGPAGGPPMRDELYCGPGNDWYTADGLDYVDSSCEKKVKGFGGGIL
jgi:Ca2+-binding RTX toxin-like protein